MKIYVPEEILKRFVESSLAIEIHEKTKTTGKWDAFSIFHSEHVPVMNKLSIESFGGLEKELA